MKVISFIIASIFCMNITASLLGTLAQQFVQEFKQASQQREFLYDRHDRKVGVHFRSSSEASVFERSLFINNVPLDYWPEQMFTILHKLQPHMLENVKKEIISAYGQNISYLHASIQFNALKNK